MGNQCTDLNANGLEVDAKGHLDDDETNSGVQGATSHKGES